ncbi:hypothetical protein LMG27177_03452 [Paraburkholderia fynbosensis]|uniref:Uncharacterized protein n=1 Tax=Paraburkholderia fynbosensis TaxID=1200993 RepID=A0A6J5G7Z0_9BURK|nr:hypothetical protein LMG27177_03452 [Paraburkholderia fynbosensis]
MVNYKRWTHCVKSFFARAIVDSDATSTAWRGSP